MNLVVTQEYFTRRRNVPVYDMNVPEDVAKYLMTLPTKARPGEMSIKRARFEGLKKQKSEEFIAEVQSWLKKLSSK